MASASASAGWSSHVIHGTMAFPSCAMDGRFARYQSTSLGLKRACALEWQASPFRTGIRNDRRCWRFHDGSIETIIG